MVTFGRLIMRFLDRDSLYLVERNLIVAAVVRLGCSWRFVVSDLLRDFEFTAVLQIRRDAGCAEGMIANPRFEAGCFRRCCQRGDRAPHRT